MKRSLNVPGSLSSALQTMNFSSPGAPFYNFPFRPRWKTCSAEAAQAAGFQLPDEARPIARGNKISKRAVVFRSAIGIGQNFLFRRFVFVFWQRFTGERVTNQEIRGRGIHARANVAVHGNCRSAVALAETRNLLKRKIGWRGAFIASLKRCAEIVGAAKMAGHIAADANVSLWRRRKAKMRIKTGYAVQSI